MNDSGVIGRSAYQQHPLAGAVFEKARASQDYVNTAQKAAQALFAVRAGQMGERTVAKGDLNTPVLTAPKQTAQEDVGSMDKLTLLLGQLMELLGDAALSVLEGRLAMFKALRESQTTANKALQEQFDNAIHEMEGALDAAKAAEGDYEAALEAAKNAQKAADEAEGALAGMSPDDPDYEATKAARDEAVSNADQAKSKADSAKEVYVKATQTASDKTKAADKIADQIKAQCGNTPSVRQSEESHITGVARMTLLMAMFSELVGNNAEASLKNDLALFEAMQTGRIKEMEKQAEEYEKEVKKAEELNKTMGCVGKILGALLTIVAVVGAAFTGGASLALAAVGVALMVADTVVKAATGVSFMEEAMKPIMEKVLKPLMDLFAKFAADILKGCGVDDKTAEMVGSIIGAVAAALAMIVVVAAVAVVGKGAAAKLASSMTKALTDMVKKMLPDVLKEVAKNSGKLLTQGVTRLTKSLGMKTDDLAIKGYGNTMVQAATAGEAAHGVVQAGGGIAQGVFIKRAADAMAAFTLARFDMEKMDKCLKEAVEVFSKSQAITQGLLAQMSQVLESHEATGRAVLRNSHA